MTKKYEEKYTRGKMKAIVAVDQNWGIGKNGSLLFDIKEDLKNFKKHTEGKVVVMGANTLRSLPNGPLKNRKNIVLSSTLKETEGITLMRSLSELSYELKKYDTDDVFIMGGGEIYRAMLPYCTEALVTKVFSDGGATVFFPNLDELENWTLKSESAPVECGGHKFTYRVYANNSVLDFSNFN
jgi:dihydrofolate reductase